MAEINASIPLSYNYGQTIGEHFKNAVSLADAMQQRQANNLAMQAKQQEMAQQAQLNPLQVQAVQQTVDKGAMDIEQDKLTNPLEVNTKKALLQEYHDKHLDKVQEYDKAQEALDAAVASEVKDQATFDVWREFRKGLNLDPNKFGNVYNPDIQPHIDAIVKAYGEKQEKNALGASGSAFEPGSPEYIIAEKVADGTLPMSQALKLYAGFGSKTGKRENLMVTVYGINPEFKPVEGEADFASDIAATRAASRASAVQPFQNEKSARDTIQKAIQGNNPAALQEKKVAQARHALLMVFSSKQPDGSFKMNKATHGELISALSSLLGAGTNATDSAREELIQRSLSGDLKEKWQYMRSQPEATIPQALIMQLRHMIERQGIESEQQRDQSIANIKLNVGRLNPDAQSRIKNMKVGIEFSKWVDENDPDKKPITPHDGSGEDFDTLWKAHGGK